MDIPGIDPGSGTTTYNGFGDMSNEDFLKIMFTELTNQDPLEPQDTQALMSQLDTIRNIEANIEMMSQLDALVEQNQLAAASNMVGKTITGNDEFMYPASGVVTSVSVEENGVFLSLDNGQRIPMEQVETIADPPSDN